VAIGSGAAAAVDAAPELVLDMHEHAYQRDFDTNEDPSSIRTSSGRPCVGRPEA